MAFQEPMFASVWIVLCGVQRPTGDPVTPVFIAALDLRSGHELQIDRPKLAARGKRPVSNVLAILGRRIRGRRPPCHPHRAGMANAESSDRSRRRVSQYHKRVAGCWRALIGRCLDLVWLAGVTSPRTLISPTACASAPAPHRRSISSHEVLSRLGTCASARALSCCGGPNAGNRRSSR